MRAFADALECIPLTLANNCGMQPISTLAEIKSQQQLQNNPFIGVDCNELRVKNMKESNVFECFISKKQQLLLATQVVKMILKIGSFSPLSHSLPLSLNTNDNEQQMMLSSKDFQDRPPL